MTNSESSTKEVDKEKKKQKRNGRKRKNKEEQIKHKNKQKIKEIEHSIQEEKDERKMYPKQTSKKHDQTIEKKETKNESKGELKGKEDEKLPKHISKMATLQETNDFETNTQKENPIKNLSEKEKLQLAYKYFEESLPNFTEEYELGKEILIDTLLMMIIKITPSSYKSPIDDRVKQYFKNIITNIRIRYDLSTIQKQKLNNFIENFFSYIKENVFIKYFSLFK